MERVVNLYQQCNQPSIRSSIIIIIYRPHVRDPEVKNMAGGLLHAEVGMKAVTPERKPFREIPKLKTFKNYRKACWYVHFVA